MIKEIIVVEGKSDIAKINLAVEAECIATEGFTLRNAVLKKIAIAYEKRGIIILTDPDVAGERIRRFLTKKFPLAKHAFVPREEAMANDDIGIEQASIASIRNALKKVHTQNLCSSNEFSMRDLFAHKLNGSSDSVERRAIVGAALGIGYTNSKQFLYRLNHYGITRAQFEEALLMK